MPPFYSAGDRQDGFTVHCGRQTEQWFPMREADKSVVYSAESRQGNGLQCGSQAGH
jgi:hypothetical protein